MGWGFKDILNTVKDRAKDPFKGLPGAGILEAGYDMLPIDNYVRAGEEFAKGNYLGGYGNMVYGNLETASMLLPGVGSAALKGGTSVAKLGAKAAAKNYASRLAAAPAKTLLGSAIKYARPDKASFVAGAVGNVIGGLGNAKTAKAVAAGVPRTTGSAANFRMVEEAQKRRVPTSAAGFRMFEERQKEEAKRKLQLNKGKIPRPINPARPTVAVAPAAPAPAPVQTPAPTGATEDQLAPLTMEQEQQVLEQTRQLQAEYDKLAAAFTRQDAEARANERQARGVAQNIASGESQNLRTDLASIGMEESPGPAIVGQESIAARSTSQQAAADKTLASILAQIEADKAKAAADKTLGQTNLEQLKNQMRISNSLAELQNMYQQFGEL